MMDRPRPIAALPTFEPNTTQLRLAADRLGVLAGWRCPRCNTMLAKIRLTPGSVVEIKCYRCNALVKECA